MENVHRSGRGWPFPPRAFFALAFMEFWERFALSGIKSILTLVLVDHILKGDRTGILGLALLQRFIEPMFGPMTNAGLASQIYGCTNALLYLSIPFGGLLGDHVAGRRGSVYLGGLFMIGGAALMMTKLLFLPALLVFAIGTGILKGNLSVAVGALFGSEAERRRGYAIYLGFLNAGVICGPLICGVVAITIGWAYAFAVAATVTAAGLGGYYLATRRLPEPMPPRTAARKAAEVNHGAQPRGDTPLLMATILSVYLCYASYDQISNMFLVWARSGMDLTIGGWPMPVAWLLSLDGLFTLLLIPATQIALRALAKRGVEISALAQIALGCLACAGGYLVLIAGDWLSGNAPVPLAAAFAYLMLIDLAIVLVWPSGLSLIASAAPPRMAGFWVGLFYLHGFFASLWVGFGGAYFDLMPATQFWLIHAGIAGAGAALAAITSLLHGRRRSPAQAMTTSA